MQHSNNIQPDWGKVVLVLVLLGLAIITVINYLIQSNYI